MSDAAPELAPAPDATPTPDAAVPDAAVPANYFADAPDTWRSDLISAAGFEGDDATKRAGQLERVLDPGTLAKNYFSAQDRIRTGEISNGLPENPTDEQMADWRTANDVPAVAADYKLTLEDGLVLGEEDGAILTPVFEVAHKRNLPAAAMSDMTNAFLKAREIEAHKMQQQDGVDTQQTTRMLKDSWGADYDTNINMVQGLLANLPETVRADVEGARMADGTGMFNSPEVMVFFADMARKLNPAGTVVPNANNPVQAVSDEIGKLEARMGHNEWFKDQAAQQRLQQLYTARDAMKAGA